MNKNCLNYYFRSKILGYIIFVMILSFGIGDANAHKINVFAWVDEDTVFVESKFSGGKRVKEGTITVSDLEGNQLLSGKTNDQGEFSFQIPKKTTLKIVLIAGMGHQGEWTIPVEEIETVSVIETRKLVQKETAENEPESIIRSIPDPVPCSDEIQLALEKALDKKLKPVMKMLAECREQGPTANDIFGGIGYIFGLAGIAAYFHYRRKKD